VIRDIGGFSYHGGTLHADDVPLEQIATAACDLLPREPLHPDRRSELR
jgi:hypothetical protein